MKDKVKEKLKNNKIIYNFLRYNYKFFYCFLCVKIFSLIFKLCPIKNNRIVVCSYYGKGYGDNPKAIVEKLLLKYPNTFEIIWALDSNSWNDSGLPKAIKKVKYKSIKNLYYLSTAKIWIDNSRKEFLPSKGRKQIYIQTWHGSYPIKKVEKDAVEKLPWYYNARAKKDSKYADLFLSGSIWTTKLIKRSFYYNGKILEYGIPKDDILIDKSIHNIIKNKVKKELNIPLKNMVVLYAPTFRKVTNYDPYNIDIIGLKSAFEKKYNINCTVIVRVHPNMLESNDFTNFSKQENVINGSYYPDMQELLILSDVLITDYSSTMFEFGLLKKPVFLYANDLKSFIGDRGFYFDIKKLPFILSENNTELLNNINRFSKNDYLKSINNFYDKMGIKETGKSSEIISDMIKEWCYEKK